MRIAMTLLAIAGNFAATVALMLALSTAANVGFANPAAANPKCDPRKYFCVPCVPEATQVDCKRGNDCCGGLRPEESKPE